jgi:hypothetical protein
VIEHLESFFGAGLGPGVIKHRHEIENEHRGDENDCAGEETGVAGVPGGYQQDRRGDDGGKQADAMTDRIGEFFAEGMRARQR